MPENLLETPSPDSLAAAPALSEFDRFFAATLSPMIAAGFDGYMKRVNRACEELAGFTAAELKAQPFSHFIHPDDWETAHLAILEMAKSGDSRAVDIRILYKDGSYRWTEWAGTPFPDQEVFYLVGKDVTDKHLAREALEKQARAAEDLERFFNNAPDVMFVGGYDGYIKRSNSALQAMTGFTAEQLMAEPIVAFAHPDEREQVAAEVQKIIAGGLTRDIELRLRRYDGSYKRVVWNASNYADLGVFYAVGTDVTAQRVAEASLAERAKQQEAVAELGKLALAASDLSQLMQGAVELAARTLQVEFAEIRELAPDRRETTLKAGFGWREGPLAQAPTGAEPDSVSGYMLSTDQPAVIENLQSETRFHGSELLREHGVTSGAGCVIHGPERPYGVLAAYSNRSRTFTPDDVRFLQAAASVLSAAINRLHAIDDFNRFFDSSPDLMIIAGFDGGIRRMNSPAGAENYLTPEDVRNQPLLSFVHPDDKETVARELEKLFTTGATKPFEARSLMKDGSYNWFSWSATAFPDRQILYAVGQNTTARRRAEEELRRLFDNSPDVLAICGFDGSFKRYNPACLTVSGFTAEEVAKMSSFLDTVNPDDRAAAAGELQKLREGGKLSAYEIRGRRKDGSPIWISWNIAAFPDWQEYFITGHVVTERHIAEEALRQRTRQQQAVAELGSRALATADLAAIMADAAATLAKTLDMEYSEILELQPGESELLLKAGFGWKEEEIGQVRVAATADTVSGYLLATKAPVIVEDLEHETRFHGTRVLHEQGTTSGMACLIPGVERPYGVLGAHSVRPRGFSDDDVHFVEAVANILAAAIDRRRGEQERERFLDRTLAPMLIIGFDGIIKYANPAASTVSGYAREELLAGPYLSLVHPDDLERTAATMPELMAGKSFHDFELRVRRKDGSYLWLAFDSSPDPDRQAFYAIAHDVTDRHLAEEALAARARQQEAIAELGSRALAGGDLPALLNDAAAVLARTLDAEFAEVFELQAGEQELLLTAGYGWRAEELGQVRVGAAADDGSVRLLTAKTPVIMDALHPESPFPEIRQFAEQGSASGMACLIQQRGRPWGILGVRSTRQRTFSDNDLHFVEAIGNILSSAIERRRAEEELNRFIEPSLNPMFVGGFDGRVKRCNQALEALSGFTSAALMSRSVWHLVHPDDRRAMVVAAKELTAGRAAKALEFRLACKDGSYKWTVWNCTSFPDWRAYYATGYDVTELHVATESLHERARQQQAVAELGAQALSGGDLQSLFEETISAVSRTLEVEFATLLELQPDGREFVLKAGYGWRPELVGKTRLPANPQFFCGYVLSAGAPVFVENVWTETRFHPYPLVAANSIVSELACVIPGRPQPHGVLCVHSTRSRKFQEDDAHFLQAAAYILAAAIDRRGAEEELKRYVEPSLNPMFVGSFDGTMKRGNHAIELLTGYSLEEMRGRPIATFVHPDDRQSVAAEIVKVATGEPAHAFSARIVAKDGSLKWTIWNATSFPEWQEFYATGQDVTEQHRAEEELRASEEMLVATDNSALDGIVLLDAEGNVAHWNAAAEKIFGYSSEEIRGRSLHQTVVPPEMHESFERGWPLFQQTGAGPVIGKVLELEALRKDGVRFPVEVSVAAVTLHGRWNAVGVIRDITSRKLQEAELIAAKKTAEAANRAKSDFLANMSHEIRTPMNGVIGLTSLVLDTELTPEQRQYLDGVMLSAEALLRIINDILDFSKIEAGRLELDHIDFDLREAVGDTVQTLALRAHEKGLELAYEVRPEAPDALVGDPARLWQVIVNLVGNAIKFTDEGEVSLSVAVETLQEHAVCLHFTVCDTGIGIPADKRQMLFKPFSQIDSSMARKYGGTGLGLAISAQIVDMMKGRIWFESELGKGSQFHFTAWFDRRTTPLAKRAPLPPSALDNLHVLVVDDNSTNRTILRDMLTHWGMRPEEADGGEVGLDFLKAAFKAGDPFGLILLDVMMPGMDGFEVLERIRQMPEIDRPVIMMLSSRDQPGDSARARKLGAAAYIIKPIRPSELLDAIVKALDISFEAGAAKPPAAAAIAAPRGPSLRILVAEDNPINQMLAVRMLEKAGHSVAKANNGQEVLAAIGQENFDVVLMDVQMPVMDGLEATALIRQQEKQTGGHLPIVAMTAHAMKGDRERCLAAGMDGYVAKPVQKADLFAAIAAAVPERVSVAT